MLCFKNTNTQPSLDISLTWLSLTDKEFPQMTADVIHNAYECQVFC